MTDTDAPAKGKAGRPFGTDAERGKDIRALAIPHTAAAIRELKKLLKDKSPTVRLNAATALLDRGYGKPVSIEERKVEQVVKVQYSDMELARRTAYLLDKAQAVQVSNAPESASVARDATNVH